MKNLIFPFLASITWGLAYAIDQKILEKISPVGFMLISYIVSLVVVVPLYFLYDEKIDPKLFQDTHFIFILLTSILLSLLAAFFIIYGIKNLGASTASMIEISYPFFVVIFSFLLYKTTPNYLFVVGSVFMFIGLAFVAKSL